MTTTATVLRGAPIADRIRLEAQAAAAVLRERSGIDPTLVTLLVGQHAAAEAYRRSIARSVGAAGVTHRPLTLAPTTTSNELVASIRQLNEDPTVNGVVVLMPLPDHLNPHLVLEHLSPLKDIDGITPINAGRLHLGLPSLRPSTPQGGIEILDHYGIPIRGRDIVVIGRSNVVGRPLATMLSLRHATVTLCHRQTRDLADATRRADIVMVAAGHPGLLTGDMIQRGAVVIDFGVNVSESGIVGDADASSIATVASAYTPVPGGTGPATTLVLARNTIAACFATLSGNLDHVAMVDPSQARS